MVVLSRYSGTTGMKGSTTIEVNRNIETQLRECIYLEQSKPTAFAIFPRMVYTRRYAQSFPRCSPPFVIISIRLAFARRHRKSLSLEASLGGPVVVLCLHACFLRGANFKTAAVLIEPWFACVIALFNANETAIFLFSIPFLSIPTVLCVHAYTSETKPKQWCAGVTYLRRHVRRAKALRGKVWEKHAAQIVFSAHVARPLSSPAEPLGERLQQIEYTWWGASYEIESYSVKQQWLAEGGRDKI